MQRRVEETGAEREEAWEEVHFVKGQAESGTTSEPISYGLTDEDLPHAADTLAYRLRRVDRDGTTAVTDPLALERTVTEFVLEQPFPNPTSGQTTVRFATPDRQEVTVQLYDMLDRSVPTVEEGAVDARQEHQIDLSDLSSGTYFLRLQAVGQTEKRQVIAAR